jgi:hypothetical protein
VACGGLCWVGVAGGVVVVVWAYMGASCSFIVMGGGVVVVVACLLSRHVGMTYGIDTSVKPRVSLTYVGTSRHKRTRSKT